MHKSWRTALIVGAIVAVFAATSAGAAKLITGGDIQNGTIGLKDLSKRAKRALKGRTGPAGPAGATGPVGPQGPAGPAAITTTIRSQEFAANGSGDASGEVSCPTGMVATGGTVSPGNLFTTVDRPLSNGAGWRGEAVGPPGERMLIAVICTPGSANVLPLGS